MRRAGVACRRDSVTFPNSREADGECIGSAVCRVDGLESRSNVIRDDLPFDSLLANAGDLTHP